MATNLSASSDRRLNTTLRVWARGPHFSLLVTFYSYFSGFCFCHILLCESRGLLRPLQNGLFWETAKKFSSHFLHVSTFNASLFSFHSSHASPSPSFSTCPLSSITSLLPSICSSFQIIAFITESLSARLSPSAGVHDYCPANQLIPSLSASP